MAESILHVGGITIRVQGSGNLKITLFGINKVKSFALNPLPMAATASIEPTKLANFKSQRTLVRIETTEINETFDINRYVVWVKPVATQYPSTMTS